jgi:hypothetical protein
MAQTTRTVPPQQPIRPRESIQEVVVHLFEAPFGAPLGVLRTTAPKILESLLVVEPRADGRPHAPRPDTAGG